MLGERRRIKARGCFGCRLLCDACLPQGDYAEKQKRDRNALTHHFASLLEHRFATVRM
jgi:hypothetical protein